MALQVHRCSFEDVLPFWKDELWPGRTSAIEPVSCLNENAEVDMQVLDWVQKYPPIYWQLLDGEKVVGVISLHRSSQKIGRMRGVWVHPNLRGRGAGSLLVMALLTEAKNQRLNAVWGMMRKESFGFYAKLGFKAERELHAFEFGPHILSTVRIRPSFSIFSAFSRF